VAEDDEIVDAGVLVGLELLLEELPLTVGAQLVEQLACHAYELLVRVVRGSLVLLLPLIYAVDLLLEARPRLDAAHHRLLIFYIYIDSRGLFAQSILTF
jgi:hypothetical protein